MNILKNTFFKNIIKVSTGTFMAQILMLLGMPIITRLYTKEIIGTYALFISTITIVTSFVTLAYDSTIVLPKKSEDANALLKISIFLAFCLSLVAVIFLNIPFDFFKKYSPLAHFIGIGAFLQVIVTCFGYFKIRHDSYKQLSISKIIRNFSLLTFQIVFFYFFSTYGLIYGFIFSSVITSIYLLYKDNNIQEACFEFQGKKVLRKNLENYIEYPKYFSWSNLIVALSAGTPIIIYNEYFSLQQIAIYSISFSLIVQPANLVASSVRPVLLSKLAKKKNTKRTILTIYNNIFYSLLAFSLLLSIGIYFLLPSIVVFIFGNSWIESGVLTRFLIPVFIWYFISIPSSVSLKIYPFQRHAFIYTIASYILITSALITSIYLNLTFSEVVLVFSLAALFFSIINHWIVKLKIFNYEKLINIQ